MNFGALILLRHSLTLFYDLDTHIAGCLSPVVLLLSGCNDSCTKFVN